MVGWNSGGDGHLWASTRANISTVFPNPISSASMPPKGKGRSGKKEGENLYTNPYCLTIVTHATVSGDYVCNRLTAYDCGHCYN